MIAALRQRLGRLKRQCDGVAAIEFAFVAPALLLLAVGTMEVSMIFFGNALLEGGVRESARFGLTGAMPPSGTREDHVVDVVNAHGAGVINVTASNVSTLVYPNFTSIGVPEPYTDDNGNGVYDSPEPFTDINCNGDWDPDMGRAGLGSGGEVVVYTVNYDMPMMTGFLDPMMGQDGKVPLTASVTVRNEPFDSGFPGC
jgi:Flp pilus assembly protein TadG